MTLRDSEKKVEAKVDATVEKEADKAVYALVHILPRFHVGDRLDGKLEQHQLDTLIEHGDASTEKPELPEEVLPVPFGVPPEHAEAAVKAASESPGF